MGGISGLIHSRKGGCLKLLPCLLLGPTSTLTPSSSRQLAPQYGDPQQDSLAISSLPMLQSEGLPSGRGHACLE